MYYIVRVRHTFKNSIKFNRPENAVVSTPVYICILIATIYFCVYSVVNHWPMERFVFPLSEMDIIIPYIDWSYIIYLSAFVQALFVMKSIPKRLLPIYIAGPSVAIIVGVIFFILYPVEYPRNLFPDNNILINFFRNIDLPGNCFPSLHVTMTILFAHIYAMILQVENIISKRLLILKSSMMWLWTISIIVSVLTTKQHYLMDVFGGIALSAFIIYIMNMYIYKYSDSK